MLWVRFKGLFSFLANDFYDVGDLDSSPIGQLHFKEEHWFSSLDRLSDDFQPEVWVCILRPKKPGKRCRQSQDDGNCGDC